MLNWIMWGHDAISSFGKWVFTLTISVPSISFILARQSMILSGWTLHFSKSNMSPASDERDTVMNCNLTYKKIEIHASGSYVSQPTNILHTVHSKRQNILSSKTLKLETEYRVDITWVHPCLWLNNSQMAVDMCVVGWRHGRAAETPGEAPRSTEAGVDSAHCDLPYERSRYDRSASATVTMTFTFWGAQINTSQYQGVQVKRRGHMALQKTLHKCALCCPDFFRWIFKCIAFFNVLLITEEHKLVWKFVILKTMVAMFTCRQMHYEDTICYILKIIILFCLKSEFLAVTNN